jgi:SAM-dependent methyltransferase
VGPKGRVVAVDIDPRFLGNLIEPNVEVRRCDITGDDVEPACYDLVHSRLLLMHLGDPAGALRRMAAALRPGGWLVAEERDNAVAEAVDRAHPLAEVFDSCNRKRIEFTSAAGITDLRFGKVLPNYMEALGLVEMGNEGVARVVHGGDPLSRCDGVPFYIEQVVPGSASSRPMPQGCPRGCMSRCSPGCGPPRTWCR